jgi:hypothetical protein
MRNQIDDFISSVDKWLELGQRSTYWTEISKANLEHGIEDYPLRESLLKNHRSLLQTQAAVLKRGEKLVKILKVAGVDCRDLRTVLYHVEHTAGSTAVVRLLWPPIRTDLQAVEQKKRRKRAGRKPDPAITQRNDEWKRQWNQGQNTGEFDSIADFRRKVAPDEEYDTVRKVLKAQ